MKLRSRKRQRAAAVAVVSKDLEAERTRLAVVAPLQGKNKYEQSMIEQHREKEMRDVFGWLSRPRIAPAGKPRA